MKKNTKILVLIFTMVMSIIFVSCNKKQTNVKKADNIKGKITVLTDKKNEQQLKLAADNFKKIHENAEIELKVEDNIYPKIEEKLKLNENPVDLVTLDDPYVQYYVNKLSNDFLDVTGDIGSYKDKILKSKIDNVTINNKIYGVPLSTQPKVILYRKDIFTSEGVNPDDIKTWNDYIEVGKKISKDTNKKFMANASSEVNNNIYLLLANQLGTSYFNKEDKVNFNSKEWVRILQVVKSFYSEGIIYELGSKYEVIDAAQKDKIVTLIADPSYASALMQNSPDYKGKWAVMKIPAFESGGNRDVSLGGSNLLINKACPNTVLAKEFVKFAVTDEHTCMDNLNKYGAFPVNNDIYNLVEFNKSLDYLNGRVWTVFSNAERGAQYINYTPYFPVIREVVENNLSQSNLGSKEIPVLLDLIQKESEGKIIKK